MKGKGRWLLLALVLAGTATWYHRRAAGPAPLGAPAERIVPAGTRIRVEVLNATTIRGLARQATFYLRDLGFDVVSSGNATERLDSSLVIVHNGRMDWAQLAASALDSAGIEARPDTSRYLDLTILLGTTWRPPPEAFHP